MKMPLTVTDPTFKPMSLADAIQARVGCDFDGIHSGRRPDSEASNTASDPALIRAKNCPALPPGIHLAGDVMIPTQLKT